MSINPTVFQKDAAEAAVAAFKKGRSRYLIADEAGLGKTIVARRVIELMSNNSEKPFIVYYFGSNLMLLNDTIKKLKKDTDWTSVNEPSKLGMMAFRDKTKDLLKDSKVLIYSFSANLLGYGGSWGDNNERKYYNDLISDNETAKALIYSGFNLIKSELIKKLIEKRIAYNDEMLQTIVLRILFERYTLSKLSKEPPDLIIFDEFHRYADRVNYFLGFEKKITKIETEFEKNYHIDLPPILFMSATPYNFYRSLSLPFADEAENEGDDSSDGIASFEELLEILAPDMKQDYVDFQKGKIKPEVFSDLLMKKCLYRNERIYDGNERYLTLPAAADFIKEFARCINEERYVSKQSGVPRYFKLCSGIYSFPIKNNNEDNFYKELKRPKGYYAPEYLFVFGNDKKLKRLGKNQRLKRIRKNQILKRIAKNRILKRLGKNQKLKRIAKNPKLKRNGDYFENLRFACIEHYNAKAGRDLLWVPPTKPEYKLGGVFGKNSDFTKLMIFSAYKMVPRIVSGVFSAYVSDDIDDADVETPVDLSSIDKDMLSLIADKLTELNTIYEDLVKKYTDKDISELIPKLMELLNSDGKVKSSELLAKYIIGSPYMCAFRAFGNENTASCIADKFNIYFKKEGIKQAIAHNGIQSAEDLLDYCIDGGLGAVMKEYAFSGGSVDDMIKALTHGSGKSAKLIDGSVKPAVDPSTVYVYSSGRYNVTNGKPFIINCHYAERFNADYTDNGKSDTSTDGKRYFRSCHNAFNSPFWPMILCTTSANQEGYDLDRYCSRIMHYSLPPNTMSFEQRDGRIDRRLSLLARRRMVRLYGKSMDWADLFKQNPDDCGMSPYWVQKDYFKLKQCNKPLKLERIIPYFPMSSDYINYSHLLDIKNAYRGHFGLPNESGSGIKNISASLKLNNIK